MFFAGIDWSEQHHDTPAQLVSASRPAAVFSCIAWVAVGYTVFAINPLAVSR